MTTLWIFGDNYSADWTKEINFAPDNLKEIYQKFASFDNTWQHRVAKSLNANVRNFALGFSSIEYLFRKFNEHRNEFQNNDTIIITVISPDIATRNFVRDIPFILTANTDFNKIKFHDPEKYTSREDAFMLYLNNFLYNLKALTIEKNLNTIVIPSQANVNMYLNNIETTEKFLPVKIANGSLNSITINEYADDIKNEAWYFRDDSLVKTNWLTKSNHKILAEKILDTIYNNTRLDVSNGFVEGLITSDNRKDINFLSKEY